VKNPTWPAPEIPYPPRVLQRFLDPARPSLKICGVTTASDAIALADLGVHALGINFWPQSKRFLPATAAAAFLPALAGRILRVGVFVNADPALPRQLLADGLIDLAQFHGDESPAYCAAFAADSLPFIKALPATAAALADPHRYHAAAILIDTPAPATYGGTGTPFDWSIAATFIRNHPHLPVILAGGITPANAANAVTAVHPAAIDIASGAESSPGIKDLLKTQTLLDALQPS
jgi:phosphoribosylanthranilate isomerase